MKPYTHDTNPEAQRRYVEQVRAMTPAERVQASFDLSERAIAQALRVIQRQHPTVDEQELRFILLSRLYGKEFADRVRVWRDRQLRKHRRHLLPQRRFGRRWIRRKGV